MDNQRKKEWIKNAIIVFLIIMLLLTLFSNTITNYTLPQVSIANVYPGSITTSIKGSGNVEAGESYSVKATESRVILSKNVEKGDHVNVGDVLYSLSDKDSKELQEARATLAETELNYYKKLLTSGMDTDTARQVNNSGASSFDSYLSKISELDNKIDELTEVVKNKKQVVANYETAINQEKVRQIGSLDAYELEKELATTAKSDAQTSFTNGIKKMTDAIDEELVLINVEKSRLSKTLDSSRIKTALIAINDGYRYAYGEDSTGITTDDINAATFLVLKNYYYSLRPLVENDSSYSALLTECYNAIENYDYALANDAELMNIEDRIAELTNAKTELNNMSYMNADSYKSALDRYNQAAANYKALESKNSKINAEYTAAKQYASDDLKTAEEELAEVKEEKKDLLTDIGNALDADKYAEDIVRKMEELDKLEANAMGATIVAPISGTIYSISKAPGEEIKSGDEICVILPDGKDMTIMMTVTNEQAKRINVGDTATLGNAWAYPDAVCVVKNIKDDPNNTGKKSQVIFSITGDNIKVGQSMNIIMDSDTREYEMVIPKSALKNDNSGKFVYALDQKSSPFGNRYIVRKVSVNVMAEDDKNIAVSGDLSAYEDIVITGSNKEPEAGKQVRLSESSTN